MILAVALSIVMAPGESRSADLVAGKSLANKWCVQCHGVRADRLGAKHLGPNISAPTFPELASEPSITEYSLRALLQSPHETMPHIKFTPDQLDDVSGPCSPGRRCGTAQFARFKHIGSRPANGQNPARVAPTVALARPPVPVELIAKRIPPGS